MAKEVGSRYGSWINADMKLPLRAGNLLIGENFFILTHVGRSRDWDLFLQNRSDLWESVCNIALEYIDFGKYKQAMIWRVFQNHMYAGWYMSVIHPNLPPVEEGCEIPQVGYNLHSDELDKIQVAMRDFFITLPNNTEEK